MRTWRASKRLVKCSITSGGASSGSRPDYPRMALLRCRRSPNQYRRGYIAVAASALHRGAIRFSQFSGVHQSMLPEQPSAIVRQSFPCTGANTDPPPRRSDSALRKTGQCPRIRAHTANDTCRAQPETSYPASYPRSKVQISKSYVVSTMPSRAVACILRSVWAIWDWSVLVKRIF
jgi:hypothetical protein